ncbi:MAG: serine/threonine-protein kinase [Rhodothermia bacterium]|nr:serine/threonine-protein kinase [Rhodothermia bacterium]
MDSDRWRQIEDLFGRAVGLTADERDQLLAHSCVGDAELRGEVESLLNAADSEGWADEVLDGWLGDEVARTVFRATVAKDVGPYRIVREIGRGGMGTVYLARRIDPQFEQQVALKLITSGVVDEEAVNRFLAERRILSRLTHSNIARLLDGGVTGAGQPFFAMEYVEGTPIDEYADDCKLSVQGRLRLFQQVCGAVQYAHQNLVVHRDIKPSNILVTEDGVVKLLDFGIAKLLDQDSDLPPSITRTGKRLMTPDFASPEQVSGKVISTSSDVYSLGVLLYRLLSGRKPYRMESGVPHEIARIICEVDPPRPSEALDAVGDGDVSRESIARLRGTEPGKLRRLLMGDLDTIVLKALHKDVDRRYISAEQFLEDIRRHVAGLPVQARPDTIFYRGSKFVRRHRIGVLSALLILVSLIGGLTGTAWQAVVAAEEAERAAQERDRARRESAKAERVTAYLIDLFAASDPAQTRGTELTARQMLDVGAQRIDDYFESQPESRATVMDAVGRVYQSLGLYKQAEQLIGMALEIRLDMFSHDHEDKAESLDHMGVLLYELGDVRSADSLLSAAVGIRRRLYPSGHGDLAESIDNLGQVRHDAGDLTQAESLYREALAMRQLLFGPASESIATSLNNLAVLHHDRGELDRAEELYRQALAMDRAVLGSRHPGIAIDLNNLGRLVYDTGDHERATELFSEALALRKLVLGERHPDVATSANNLAAALHEADRLQEAEVLYREALRIRERSFGREHPRVAISLNNIASVLEDQGDVAGAEVLLRESLEIRRRLFGNEHAGVATILHNLGRLLGNQGRTAPALAHLREAVSIREAQLGPEHPLVASSFEQLGRFLLAKRDFDAAEAAVRRALSINEASLPSDHSSVSDVRKLLDEVMDSREKISEG